MEANDTLRDLDAVETIITHTMYWMHDTPKAIRSSEFSALMKAAEPEGRIDLGYIQSDNYSGIRE